MKIKVMSIIGLFSFVISMSGCAGFMHGYTKNRAMGKYLLVDQKKESFGYKRLTYIEGFRPPLEGFIENQGLPDFIYEFTNKQGREGINLYYVSNNIVYIYVARDWRPDSIYLKEERELTDYEITTYEKIKETQQ